MHHITLLWFLTKTKNKNRLKERETDHIGESLAVYLKNNNNGEKKIKRINGEN